MTRVRGDETQCIGRNNTPTGFARDQNLRGLHRIMRVLATLPRRGRDMKIRGAIAIGDRVRAPTIQRREEFEMRALQKLSVLIASFAMVSAAVGAALAQDYPTRPVHVIVGFPAGSGADITARVVGQRMGQILGQQIVVENKAGAGSSLAAEFVSRAPKDGYTLLLATVANPILAVVNSNLSYAFPKDFAPIARLSTTPNILVVHPSIGVKSVKELIAYAKANPDKLSFGSSGVATVTHLSGELLKVMAGIKMVHVPYPGSAQAVTDLLAGRIQVLFTPASGVLQHARAGKVVALASTESKRAGVAQDLPTMAEAGLPGFETGLWFGLLAPAGTPGPIVGKLNSAANESLKSADVTKVLAPQGIDAVGGSAADFAKYLDGEMKRWAPVAAAAGLKK
jgi:tripartite-type tricarboxylate transporter receptor subunit TctC